MTLTRGGVAALSAGLTLLLAGCGGGRAPIYTLHETEQPLRYQFIAEGSQSVETPNGPAGGSFDTDAVMLLSIGGAVDKGRAFSVSFESFGSTLSSQMGSRRVDGSSVTGPVFRGIVGDAGEIRMTEIPQMSAGSYDQNSLVGMFPDILAPLPPDGADTDAGWPHAYVLPTGGGLDGETSYSGTAGFAGDTTWNGLAARVIVSNGTFHVEGQGIPEGAPGEVSLTADGDGSAVYVWDPATGLLLAVSAESSNAGTVRTMGFDLPLEIRSTRTVELLR